MISTNHLPLSALAGGGGTRESRDFEIRSRVFASDWEVLFRAAERVFEGGADRGFWMSATSPIVSSCSLEAGQELQAPLRPPALRDRCPESAPHPAQPTRTAAFWLLFADCPPLPQLHSEPAPSPSLCPTTLHLPEVAQPGLSSVHRHPSRRCISCHIPRTSFSPALLRASAAPPAGSHCTLAAGMSSRAASSPAGGARKYARLLARALRRRI